jgi:hypothetical protein
LVESKASALVLTIACALLILLPMFPTSEAQSSWVGLSINPSMYVAHQEGELFNITINIDNVGNLSNYQLTIKYNNSLLGVAQVTCGTFFPAFPNSHFSFDNSTSPGSLQINCSLSNPANPVGGRGTLALVTFRALHAQTSGLESPLKIAQSVLLDSKLNPIVHDSVDAVYFWDLMEPDPPVDGRLLDVYTQNGGVGEGQPDGNFTLGEVVYLTTSVSYNGMPVQSKLIAFQVKNPLNQTIVIRTAISDTNGMATVSFKIPNDVSSIGTWSGISVVDIAQEVVWDTITFQVNAITPVGGFSIALNQSPRINLLAPYQIMVFALILVFVATKRVAKHN